MREQDKNIFCKAAQKFNAWILVRYTNGASLDYIGNANYTPKPITCKAKTAKHDSPLPIHRSYKIAGLVADPYYYSAVYGGNAKYWDDTLTAQGMTTLKATKTGYGTDSDPASKHYKCLTLDGKYLYGDYDLFDIVPVGHERRNLRAVEELSGQPHLRGPLVIRVANFINSELRCNLIQHGGAYQYDDSFEKVLVFKPMSEGGIYDEWEAAQVMHQYKEVWKRPLHKLLI